MASDVKLLPDSAANAPGSTTPTDWTCDYVPADQYQRWLHGFHDALSVEIYLFPKKLVSKRLLGTLDGHAALRRGAATVSGQIMLAGEESPVTSFRTGYGAWTGQRLPDGSYSALAIYLSSRQAPRTAAEFRNELQAMAQVSGLELPHGEQIELDPSGRRMAEPHRSGAGSATGQLPAMSGREE